MNQKLTRPKSLILLAFLLFNLTSCFKSDNPTSTFYNVEYSDYEKYVNNRPSSSMNLGYDVYLENSSTDSPYLKIYLYEDNYVYYSTTKNGTTYAGMGEWEFTGTAIKTSWNRSIGGQEIKMEVYLKFIDDKKSNLKIEFTDSEGFKSHTVSFSNLN